jgi:hypothetical protein
MDVINPELFQAIITIATSAARRMIRTVISTNSEQSLSWIGIFRCHVFLFFWGFGG